LESAPDVKSPQVIRSNRRRFFYNVIWSWAGVFVNLLLGVFLSPIIVRKLGVERYGLWALLFSTMDYLRILDFGFRAAVVNSCARHKARGNWTGVNENVVTAITYFIVIAGICCLGAFASREHAMTLFKISPALHFEAEILILLIAFSVSVRLVFSPVTGALEAFQRFDLINRAYICALMARATGSLAVLWVGGGLIGLAVVFLCVQAAETLWNVINLKSIFPAFRVSLAFVRKEALVGMFRYGRHSASMAAANLVSIQAPATVLGFLRGPADVGFFVLPLRLLMYSNEAFAKVGFITSSVTADLDERRETKNVWKLAVLTNRHCLAMFMPLALFLSFYATPLLSVWVSPVFAVHSGPLVPVLTAAFLISVAGQYNAGAILIGQGKHAAYAHGILLEVILSVSCLFLIVPSQGPFGAACVAALALFLSRGVYLSILICRVNGFSYSRYIGAIYGRAMLTAIPALAVTVLLRSFVFPGNNWFELIAAAVTIAGVYFSLALFTVIEPAYRDRILRLLRLRS
jgi:O-antigen/teichoic acid export membrane protein